MPTKNGRPLERPFTHRAMVRRSGTGAQTQFSDPHGEIESDRAVHRDRLQRDRAVGAADQNIGAEAGGDCHLAGRAEIVAGEKAGIGGPCCQ